MSFLCFLVNLSDFCVVTKSKKYHLFQEAGISLACLNDDDALKSWLHSYKGAEKALELFDYLYDSYSETARLELDKINEGKDFSPEFVTKLPFFTVFDLVTSTLVSSVNVQELLQFKRMFRLMLFSAMTRSRDKSRVPCTQEMEALKKEILYLTHRCSSRARNAVKSLFYRFDEDVDALYDFLTQENFTPLRIPKVGRVTHDEVHHWCTEVKKTIQDFRDVYPVK